jgi:lipooligosaccharide transport system permease protein
VSESATAPAAARSRIGRLERPALAGVLVREIVNFSSYWRGTTFSATVEPTIYLLAFGFGFGSLVSHVGGYRYV